MVLGRGKNIVGGSDGEAEEASFHLPKILPCELTALQIFPASPVWSCLDCDTALVHLAAIKINALAVV